MDSVQDGIARTSLMIDQTRSVLAAMSIVVSIRRTDQPFGVSGAGERVSLLRENSDAIEKIGS
jgi:hypothetical protein